MTADQKLAILTGMSTGTSSAAATWTDFVATNPTPGTAITSTIVGSYSATGSAFLLFRNTSAAGPNAKTTFLDYIKLLTAIVPGSGTSAQYAIFTDGENSNRYTSGATATPTPANPAGGSFTSAVTQINVGALVTAAASSQARQVARGSFRGVIPVTGDEYILAFGGTGAGGTNAPTATAAGRFVVNAPVVSFGPQQYCLVHLWFPSNSATAATFEFELGFFEVPVA